MRVRFFSAITVRKNNGTWTVLEPFTACITRDDGTKYVVTVPAGFHTDFASVPRLPFAYLLAGNTAHRSAVLHDYLYAMRYNRKFADRAFLAAMEQEGLPGWQRYMMYGALRAFGWVAYSKVRSKA